MGPRLNCTMACGIFLSIVKIVVTVCFSKSSLRFVSQNDCVSSQVLAGEQNGSEQGSPLEHEQLLILIKPRANHLRQKLISPALAWMANAVWYRRSTP